MRPSLLHHYKKGEAETLRRVLDEIDTISGKRTKEGLNEFNFTLGVCNCVSFVFVLSLKHIVLLAHDMYYLMLWRALFVQFFIAYMFGAHPEHIWLIYLVEGMYMIPRKFYTMWNAKP